MMGKKKYANGGQQQLFAYKDIPLATRLGKYFSGLINIDSIHDAAKVEGRGGLHLPYTIRYMAERNFHRPSWEMALNTQVPDVL